MSSSWYMALTNGDGDAMEEMDMVLRSVILSI